MVSTSFITYLRALITSIIGRVIFISIMTKLHAISQVSRRRQNDMTRCDVCNTSIYRGEIPNAPPAPRRRGRAHVQTVCISTSYGQWSLAIRIMHYQIQRESLLVGILNFPSPWLWNTRSRYTWFLQSSVVRILWKRNATCSQCVRHSHLK